MIKIAVVEDEKSLQKVMLEWLYQEGYKAVGFSTGREAVEGIPNGSFDLVLLDIIIPEISGYEVIQHLRGDPKTKDLPIVVLSNLGDREGIKKAMDLGADSYLIKADYDLSAVKNVIIEVLKKGKKDEIS